MAYTTLEKRSCSINIISFARLTAHLNEAYSGKIKHGQSNELNCLEPERLTESKDNVHFSFRVVWLP